MSETPAATRTRSLWIDATEHRKARRRLRSVEVLDAHGFTKESDKLLANELEIVGFKRPHAFGTEDFTREVIGRPSRARVVERHMTCVAAESVVYAQAREQSGDGAFISLPRRLRPKFVLVLARGTLLGMSRDQNSGRSPSMQLKSESPRSR